MTKAEVKKLSQVLNPDSPYLVDFYQREYRWGEEQAKELLEDIFHIFNKPYESEQPDCFLNTIILHKKYDTQSKRDRLFLIDGQQRITTLLLILRSLRELLTKGTNLSGDEGKKLSEKLGKCIKLSSGEFPIQHDIPEKKEDNNTLEERDITSENMDKNFKAILGKLRDEYTKKWNQTKHLDEDKFIDFGKYCLDKVKLALVTIETSEAPEVFEGINDRGKGVRPYEVLKGKLLGKIESDKERKGCLKIWNEVVKEIRESIGKEKKEENWVDDFFQCVFKGLYGNLDKKMTEEQFAKKYHRSVFTKKRLDSDKAKKGLDPNETSVKDFIKKNLRFYAYLFSYVHRHIEAFRFVPPHKRKNNKHELDKLFWILLFALFSDIKKDDYCETFSDPARLGELGNVQKKIRCLSFEYTRIQQLLNIQDVGDEGFKDSGIFFDQFVDRVLPEIREGLPEDFNDFKVKVRDHFDDEFEGLLKAKWLTKSKPVSEEIDIFKRERLRAPKKVGNRTTFLSDVEYFLREYVPLGEKKELPSYELEHVVPKATLEEKLIPLIGRIGAVLLLGGELNKEAQDHLPDVKIENYYPTSKL
ncbi:MAG: DUF262 domain-containing protein, partial [Cytophagales bacterium]|nr:DUF262 domain-containing protein [Cytophagales bacterium]